MASGRPPFQGMLYAITVTLVVLTVIPFHVVWNDCFLRTLVCAAPTLACYLHGCVHCSIDDTGGSQWLTFEKIRTFQLVFPQNFPFELKEMVRSRKFIICADSIDCQQLPFWL